MQPKLSSQQERKKQHEKEILTEFGVHYADFPLGTVIACEEPDFLIQTRDKIIGIEVLEFHKKEEGERSSQLRERESFHERLSEQARSLFESKYQIPLQVIFHGHGHHQSARPHELELLANCIVDLIEHHIPQAPLQEIKFDRNELSGTPVANIIHGFSTIRLKPGSTGVWAFSETSWPETTVNELQQEILIKDVKVDKYLEQCASVWLIIVVGGRYIATMADFPRDLSEHPFRFRFERVLVYNRVTQNVLTLVKNP